MRELFSMILGILLPFISIPQSTVFELSKGTASATYNEAIRFYRQLDSLSNKVTLIDIGPTDAGFPLQLVLVSNDGNNNPDLWKKTGKVVLMVNNGIHPGEPDGIDASLMLVRDIVTGTKILPDNICLGIIPIYNVGGALNRGSYSRVNQNGPVEYGFRGNAQNLDLNRDFTKADSRNARSFAKAFHMLDPDILIDNHVSDGADFQHVFTLLAPQYDKLGEPLGTWLRKKMEPELYKGMAAKGWDIFPYVNFDSYDLGRGMTQFYDPPRYSSGYAALFQTIAFMPETHMLKPYKDRVSSTYDFMVTTIATASKNAASLKTQRQLTRKAIGQSSSLPLAWTPDKTKFDEITFLGYERDTVLSEVTHLPQLHYNRSKPFSALIKYFSYFQPGKLLSLPRYYVIPQGWHEVIDRLKENGVIMQALGQDSSIQVTAYHIENYKASPRPYEKHFRIAEVIVEPRASEISFRKGDWLISLDQPARRYLLEMLEPTGDDSFFSWNYFDAILQQKEGYSDYRWDEVAAEWLSQNPALRMQLENKLKEDAEFAKNSRAILNWVYKNSPYYEPAHLRYPVFRIEP